MKQGTFGQLWLKSILPEDVYHGQPLDKKGLANVLSEVGKRYPEKYRDISFKLNQIGSKVAYTTGGNSFGLKHLLKSTIAKKNREVLKQQIQSLLADKSLTPEERDRQIINITADMVEGERDKIYDEADAAGNPLTEQLKGAGRGNRINLASLIGSDGLYVDHRGKPIPMPILRSYSEGLTPAEYWASTYGARQGLIQTKFSVADTGFFGKQLAQMGHRLMVTDLDGDGEPDTVRGLPVDTMDNDNEGALLAAPVGPYARNTVLTPKILRDINAAGHSRILVRSPAVYGPKDGGVYARDVGIREFGTLPTMGSRVGTTAAQAIGEPLSQAMLCLARGTLVRMADQSTKAIEDIVVGDWVMGADIRGNAFPTQVTKTFDNGERECVETHFRYCGSHAGSVLRLRSTTDHKILAITMKSECSEAAFNNIPRVIPVGAVAKRFSAILPEHVADAQDQGLADGLLLGLLLGDGCFTESVHGVFLSCADKSLIDDLTDYLADRNLRLSLAAGQKIYYRLSTIQQPAAEQNSLGQFCSGYRNPAARLLDSYELMGKYAHEKSLPEQWHSWSKSALAAVIAGLWITDGSIYLSKSRGVKKVALEFGSTSETMVAQVREILATRFAIYASKVDTNRRPGRRDYFSIAITAHSSVQRFLAQISLLGVKAVKARQWAGVYKPAKTATFSRCRRTSQNPVGKLHTHDIQVANDDSLFVLANGLIVSNSGKHSGGVKGASSTQSTFQTLNQLLQVPRVVKGGAAHSTQDGVVQRIEPAPAGGNYVYINGQPHYVSQGFDIHVKPGQAVEAGDVISEGMPNPAAVVEHKGVGEGRRYFIDTFRKALRDGGVNAHRRNVELVARGLINHVRTTGEIGEYVPDDVVQYSVLEHSWEPRQDSRLTRVADSQDRFLEKPYLHYSIGTKVRPSVMKNLQEFGVADIQTHDKPPPFEPEMVRGMGALQHDPDWMTRMYGSYLKDGLLEGVHRGATSDENSTSFVPSLAKGVNFGKFPPKPTNSVLK